MILQLNLKKSSERPVLKKLKSKRWQFIIVFIVLGGGVWQLPRCIFPEEEKQIRIKSRETVKRYFPAQTAKIQDSYGLNAFPDTSTNEQPAKDQAAVVVLVHGLDDPGKVWMNLAPVLAGNSFTVWVLNYPNDQPVVESSRFFLEELHTLYQRGVRTISVVAHSMGGLVSREMLTHPEWDYIGKVRRGEAPAIKRLIMVGTPNHGSEMVRFRVLSELRDQSVNLFKGEFHWLRWIIDGAGEAGIDLLPQSRFLETLNRRPHPQGVEMLIIAGIMSPWQANDLKHLTDNLQPQLPKKMNPALISLKESFQNMNLKIGDGLVTVASTRLKGIPHITVKGTHLSIIRNLSSTSQRMPPAIPIIVEQLKNL
jgi:pimeloyl-ACP methyl ester carboxylesterase